MNGIAAAGAVLLLLGALGAPAPPRGGKSAFPPPLAAWASRKTGTLPAKGKEEPDFIAAQLDGRGGQEVVTFADVVDARDRVVEGKKEVAVYTWRGGGFAQLFRGQLPLNWLSPAAGDLDRDGRDELYGVGTDNGIQTLRLENDRLAAAHSERLGTWPIGAMVVSDFRQPGTRELLLAVDTRQRFGTDAEPECNLLLGYRPASGGWKKSFQAAIRQRGMSLTLLSGSYLPGGGTTLVLEHDPSDVSDSLFEAYRWDGKALKKLRQFTARAQSATGLQRWIGAAGGLTPSERTIVAHSIFMRASPAGETVRDRGELVVWEPAGPRARFALPGEPKAVGDFRAPGETGILTGGAKQGFTLWEPQQRPADPYRP